MGQGWASWKARSPRQLRSSTSFELQRVLNFQSSQLYSLVYTRTTDPFTHDVHSSARDHPIQLVKRPNLTISESQNLKMYRDDDNDVNSQLQRFAQLHQHVQREMARVWLPPAVKFHDFLNAMAGAKACKQPGIDGVVVETLCALS